MRRFIKGDIVKCVVDQCNSLTKGYSYVVDCVYDIGIDSDSDLIYGIDVNNDLGDISFYYSFRFELDVESMRDNLINNILK